MQKLCNGLAIRLPSPVTCLPSFLHHNSHFSPYLPLHLQGGGSLLSLPTPSLASLKHQPLLFLFHFPFPKVYISSSPSPFPFPHPSTLLIPLCFSLLPPPPPPKSLVVILLVAIIHLCLVNITITTTKKYAGRCVGCLSHVTYCRRIQELLHELSSLKLNV